MNYFGTSILDVSEKLDLVFSVSKINSPEKSDGTPLTSHSSLSIELVFVQVQSSVGYIPRTPIPGNLEFSSHLPLPPLPTAILSAVVSGQSTSPVHRETFGC